MKSEYKCGDLVHFHRGYENGNSIYWLCKVMDLIVDGESYYSYIVTTGEGDSNTKIKFKLKPLSYYKFRYGGILDNILEFKDVPDIFESNKSHDISLNNMNYYELEYKKILNTISNNMKLLYKNRNINDKIEDILDN